MIINAVKTTGNEIALQDEKAILYHLMGMLKNEISAAERRLKTEESGNKIAYLQGKCAGYMRLSMIMNECCGISSEDIKEYPAFIQLKEIEKEDMWDMQTIEYKDLEHWYGKLRALQHTAAWTAINTAIDAKITQKKNYLYFSADKSRDLYFARGWHIIITAFSEWIEEIEQRYTVETEKREKERKECLPFDEFETA
ncbi:MAG: hypothetical protein P1P65_00655 [Treponema sp.]